MSEAQQRSQEQARQRATALAQQQDQAKAVKTAIAAAATKAAQRQQALIKQAKRETGLEKKIVSATPVSPTAVPKFTGAERVATGETLYKIPEISKKVTEININRAETWQASANKALTTLDDTINKLSDSPSKYLIKDDSTGEMRRVKGYDIDKLKSDRAALAETISSNKQYLSQAENYLKDIEAGLFTVTYKQDGRTNTKRFKTLQEAQNFAKKQAKIAKDVELHREHERRFKGLTDKESREVEIVTQRNIINKLEKAGTVERVTDREGKVSYTVNKPVQVLTRKEEQDLRKAGFKIPEMGEGLSWKLYQWGNEAFKDSKEWKTKEVKARNFSDFVKSQTEYYSAVLGTSVEALVGPYKAVKEFVTGKPEPLTKEVTTSTLKYLEKLTPSQQASLYAAGFGASYLGSYVAMLPVGVAATNVVKAAGSIVSKIPVGKLAAVIPGAAKMSKPKLVDAVAQSIAAHPKLMTAILAAPVVGMEAPEVYRKYLDKENLVDVMGYAAQRAGVLVGSAAGFQAGIKLGRELSFPVKRGTVEIPLENGGVAKWKGTYVEIGKDAHPISGGIKVYDKAGKLLTSADETQKILSALESRRGYVPQSKIDSAITKQYMEALKYGENEFQKISDVRKILSVTQNIPSRYIDDILPTRTNTLGKEGIDAFKRFALDNSDDIQKIYGSFAVKNQLDPSLGYRLSGTGITSTRLPGDIDMLISGSEENAENVIRRLYQALKDAGEKVRINPGKPTLIETYIDGKWVHAIDGHASGAVGATGDVVYPRQWGFVMDKPGITIEGLKVQSAGEQALRKGTSILGFLDDGTLGPLGHRGKDIVDFVHVSQTLQNSKAWWASSVQKEINSVRNLYGVVTLEDIQDIYDTIVKSEYVFRSASAASPAITPEAYLRSLGISPQAFYTLGSSYTVTPNPASPSQALLSQLDVSSIGSPSIAPQYIVAPSPAIIKVPDKTDYTVTLDKVKQSPTISKEDEKPVPSLGSPKETKLETPSPPLIGEAEGPPSPTITLEEETSPPPTKGGEEKLHPLKPPQKKPGSFQFPMLKFYQGKKTGYRVVLTYPSGSKERLQVEARSYVEAMSMAARARSPRKEMPIQADIYPA